MGAQEHRRQKRIRQTVIDRDGMVCCYCGDVLTVDTITMEHIVPDSKKGTFNSTNLTVSCSHCNNKRGNQPFFDYCKRFNWPNKKISKYKNLYISNLKIKVLNIAKEECLVADEAVPTDLINRACKILKIKSVDLSPYKEAYQLEIDFAELCQRKKIKHCFEQLIKIIESNTY